MFCISDFYTDGKDGNWLMEKDRQAMNLRTFSVPVKRPACLWDSGWSFYYRGSKAKKGFYFYGKLTKEEMKQTWQSHVYY